MSVQQLLSQFENSQGAESRAKLLRESGVVPGFSEAFFYRVAELISKNPGQAKALAASWKAVVRYGDDRAFGYRAKGAYDRLNGQWLAAAASFDRAGKIARDEVARLANRVGAVDSLARGGKFRSAVTLGGKLYKGLIDAGQPALAGRAMLNVGNAYLWQDRHDEAEKAFQIAAPLLDGAERAMAQLGLSTAAFVSSSPAECLALAQQAAAEFESLGMTYYVNLCRINEAHAQIRQGQPDEGARILLSVRSQLVPGDLDFARTEQFLGEAYLQMQREQEALTTFQSALAQPGLKSSPLNVALVRIGLGVVDGILDRPVAAKVQFRTAQRFATTSGNPVVAAWADVLAIRTIKKPTTSDLNTLRRAISLFRKERIRYLTAETLLDLASHLPASEGQPLVRESERLISRFGFLALAWRPYSLLAGWAKADRAIPYYRQMVRSILVHRLALSSIASRTSLLNDKDTSIRAFMSLLLKSGRSEDIEEAVGVVTSLRSATLIDEILAQQNNPVSNEQRAALKQLRDEVGREQSTDLPGGARGASSTRHHRPSWDRLHLESLGIAAVERGPNPSSADSTSNILTFLSDAAAWISGYNVIFANVQQHSLEHALRWIHFDLFAPLSGIQITSNALEAGLSELKHKLQLDALQRVEGVLPISIEGCAYQVPWPLLTDDDEPLLLLYPGKYIHPVQISLGPKPKTAIWYHDRKDLPHLAEEVAAFIKHFPDAHVCRTVNEALDCCQMGPFDLLHVAGHGNFHPSNPMFSSIEMSDGRLLATDIARSGLQVKVATVASCDSAMLGQRGGFEPQGLTRAFLTCGAQVVIASLWPLDDRVSCAAFKSFYDKLSAGETVLNSVRYARSEARSTEAHPLYWGPFMMIGGYCE